MPYSRRRIKSYAHTQNSFCDSWLSNQRTIAIANYIDIAYRLHIWMSKDESELPLFGNILKWNIEIEIFWNQKYVGLYVSFPNVPEFFFYFKVLPKKNLTLILGHSFICWRLVRSSLANRCSFRQNCFVEIIWCMEKSFRMSMCIVHYITSVLVHDSSYSNKKCILKLWIDIMKLCESNKRCLE